MFELAWSKVLIIAIAAIVVVGPKDLPMVLRTVGRYLGYLRRQADEFKQQFNDAMREAELDSVQKEFEEVKKTTEDTFRGIEQTVDETVKSAGHIGDDINRPVVSPPQAAASTTPPEIPPAAHTPAALSHETIASESTILTPSVETATAPVNGAHHKPNGSAVEAPLSSRADPVKPGV